LGIPIVRLSPAADLFLPGCRGPDWPGLVVAGRARVRRPRTRMDCGDAGVVCGWQVDICSPGWAVATQSRWFGCAGQGWGDGVLCGCR